MSRPKSAAVKDIDIAKILGQKYRYRINIGNGDIDRPRAYTQSYTEKICIQYMRLLSCDVTRNTSKLRIIS